ncbi:CBS domain-containing protein [Hahella sp. KA22]|uniref:putative nucleotidyltransferase substrate binding domain-containing protein n=1 Tax=Hahella sp. KA22 TaxID=1628392 RepID=UPI000FDE599B|nr:putative nucleotidyltransferase substrate binding domain-containing protein [Hahella sp. KA22]AZZ91089.1 CBS domain-containing protein [Hahella sp. KA22]QAY54458.1 CBS domain-containing protein [Hahella sp. KA22]
MSDSSPDNTPNGLSRTSLAEASGSDNALPQNIRSLMNFLRAFAPFKQMDDGPLATLLEKSSIEFFPADAQIIGPDDGAPEKFYIVKQGYIVGERDSYRHANELPTFDIGPGACFPVAALLGERPTRTLHKAQEDTFCITCSKEHFSRMLAICPVFRDFCLRGVSSLLDQVNRQIQAQAQSTLGEDYSLNTPLSQFIERQAVHCEPTLSIRKAVRIMDERGVGSMVVTDANRKPIGIFTLRDLRRFIAGPGADLDAPISSRMNADPISLSPDATAFEAALIMAKHHFAHVLIAENGKLVGVVSERDLFSLQRVNLVHIARTLANAPSVDALAALQSDVARLAETMIAHGASAEQLNHIVTLLNDYSTRQVIRLIIKEQGDPGVAFSWITFGSAGRREQTLLTDQDNGIIFELEDSRLWESARQRLLPLASRINAALDQCGFTLCKGNIMAGNPKLCLSAQEWDQRFNGFIEAATPQNVLNSCIFFDLRTQWGDATLASRMFAPIRRRIQQHTLFQRMLATAALEHRPPLGLFKGFVTRKEHGQEGVDLKKQGLTPFVDAARVLSLAHGVEASNTIYRLRQLSEANVLETRDARAWEEAFDFIQLLRLRHHLQCKREGKELTNLVAPDALNDLDQRILKEACRQAQRLQRKLAWSYQL